MYKIFTINLLLSLSFCSLLDFSSNPNLDLLLNERMIRIISPLDLTDQFVIDQLPLSICIRDYLGIKQVTISIPKQTLNPVINTGTKATIINTTLFISNIEDPYPVTISYTDMNNRTVESNYTLSVKALSTHFSVDLPPNKEAAVEKNDSGVEVWRDDPELQINMFISGASAKKVTLSGIGSSVINTYDTPVPNPLILEFKKFSSDPPSGDLTINISICSEYGEVTETNIILS